MAKNKSGKYSPYHSGIIKGIFKGMTIEEIAKDISCSRSTVSYHIKSLYEKYKAKTRCDFILNVFAEIIDKYKLTIDKKDIQIDFLKTKIKKMQRIMEKLDENKNSPNALNRIMLEAKECI